MRKARDYVALAVARQWYGYLLSTFGSFSAARDAYDEAIRAASITKAGSPAAWATLGLGGISRATGDLAAATSYTARASEMFVTQKDRVGVASALSMEAGIAQRAGDFTKAEQKFIAYRAMERELGAKNELPGIERDLARVALDAGRLDDAEKRLDEAERLAREQNATGMLIADVPFFRGEVALRQHQYVRAESLFTTVVPRAGTSGYHQHQVQLRIGLARLARGDVSGGESALDSAQTALERWRASLSDKDLRLAVVQTDPAWGLVNDGWPTAIATLARAGRIASAFSHAEAVRARELRDRAIQATIWQDADSASARAAVAARPVAPNEVAGFMGDSTAMLMYVAGQRGEPSTLFVLGSGAPRALTLPTADSLAQDVERFVGLLESGATPRELAARLGETLLGEALASLPPTVTRLVVVPDGPLHRLPFDALRLRSGDWAASRYAIALAPSATVAVRLAERPRDAAGRTLVALGDPLFPGELSTPDARVLRDGFTGSGGLPRLPTSGVEATRVGEYGANALVRLRSGASEWFLKQQHARRISVLHLATHALVDDRAYGRSAIALAAGSGDDGFLTVQELGAARIDAELVVLSACRTAGGVLLEGEGVRGLTAPLLEAGARAVVATQWAIGDRSALPLIDRFYAELARGARAVDALQRVKAEAIRAGVSPRDWAAFTIVGDGAVRPSLRVVRTKPVPWVLAER
jgi:tetratricopeptide (TPR) repeat protein